MLELSVIICSHNPRAPYLRRVLDALREQTLPRENWELLLVDNASRAPLASAVDISWHPHGRHILENELGLAPARRRGMREATSDVFVFVDDDNVLDLDYLSETLRIKQSWPSLGVWGSGTTVGDFEMPPPPYLEKYLPCLALRNTKAIHWTNVFPCLPATPWGAGLCVRASVAQAYCEHCDQSEIQVTDRRGNNLLSGGDVEISFVACKIGFGMGTFPQLKLVHIIPKERLRDDYLIKIVEGTALSDHLLAFKWRNVIPGSPLSVRGALSVLKHTLLTRGLDRRAYFAQLRASIQAKRIIAASLAASTSTVIEKVSP
jgi:glycosyltransferase involved in cell wall biosynthesis